MGKPRYSLEPMVEEELSPRAGMSAEDREQENECVWAFQGEPSPDRLALVRSKATPFDAADHLVNFQAVTRFWADCAQYQRATADVALRALARLSDFSLNVECQIRTLAGYEAAIREVEILWGAKLGTPEGDRLDALATLIAAYDAKGDINE